MEKKWQAQLSDKTMGGDPVGDAKLAREHRTGVRYAGKNSAWVLRTSMEHRQVHNNCETTFWIFPERVTVSLANHNKKQCSGNCSAKSLASNVADSSLSCLSSVGGGSRGRGLGRGREWG